MNFLKYKIQNEHINYYNTKRVYDNRIKTGDLVWVRNFNPYSQGSDLQEFLGLCISAPRKGLGSSVKLRNVLSYEALEQSYQIYSGLTLEVCLAGFYIRKKKYKNRAKLYFLRNRSTRLVNFPFEIADYNIF